MIIVPLQRMNLVTKNNSNELGWNFFFLGVRGDHHLDFIHRPLEGKTVHDLQQEIQLDKTQQRREEMRTCNLEDKT